MKQNQVWLSNPLETITTDGPEFFNTYSGINMTVTDNYLAGAIGAGFVVRSREGAILKNVVVNNEYENCLGEEVVLNDHPDKEEVNKGT